MNVVLLFFRNDATQTGYCLGGPGQREALPTPERTLAPAACAILRALMHCSLIWASCNNEVQGITIKTKLCTVVNYSSKHSSIYVSIFYQLIHSCSHPSIYPSIPSILLLIHPSIHPSIHPFIHLSIHPFINSAQACACSQLYE